MISLTLHVAQAAALTALAHGGAVQESALQTGGAVEVEASEEPAPNAFTVETWTSCAECHAAPDARIPHDARWIGLNRTTACLTEDAATPENRARLIAYLTAGDAEKPPLFRSSAEDPDTAEDVAMGSIQTPATEGSAYLRRVDVEPARTVRIAWSQSDDGGSVALPEGSYELIGYCFYRTGPGGGQWTASATVQAGTTPDAITVSTAERAKLPILSAVFTDLTATREDGELNVSFQMRNEAGDRMTLVRNGALVEPSWELFGPDETTLARGSFAPT